MVEAQDGRGGEQEFEVELRAKGRFGLSCRESDVATYSTEFLDLQWKLDEWAEGAIRRLHFLRLSKALGDDPAPGS